MLTIYTIPVAVLDDELVSGSVTVTVSTAAAASLGDELVGWWLDGDDCVSGLGWWWWWFDDEEATLTVKCESLGTLFILFCGVPEIKMQYLNVCTTDIYYLNLFNKKPNDLVAFNWI